ncbi:MAG: hypothetical protein A3F40_01220 [Chlamydiae bacterium RIFCSPHIGHO2_12_FULL_27_8]|nr:MAG: hypothetical protein A3F40_01220 [Chlamydiae bacterium RIFCSPHIGHO2_12_FULL_27_8]
MGKEKFTEKLKDGVSVEEIEKFARKYTTEMFLILSLIIATISSIFGFFTGPSWSIFFAGLLAIIGIAMPIPVGKLLKKLLKLQMNSEKSTTIVIGIVRLVLSIFIPFILFAELGLLAGHAFHSITKLYSYNDKDTEEKL